MERNLNITIFFFNSVLNLIDFLSIMLNCVFALIVAFILLSCYLKYFELDFIGIKILIIEGD